MTVLVNCILSLFNCMICVYCHLQKYLDLETLTNDWLFDAILILRLLSELHSGFQKPLHTAFVDVKSPFDSVDRAALACSEMLLKLIEHLYTGTSARVKLGQKLSPRFVISGRLVYAKVAFSHLLHFVPLLNYVAHEPQMWNFSRYLKIIQSWLCRWCAFHRTARTRVPAPALNSRPALKSPYIS